MLALLRTFQGDGQHGRQCETVRIHTEAATQLTDMPFQIVRIGAADVHGLGQFAEEGNELLLHAALSHGSRHG